MRAAVVLDWVSLSGLIKVDAEPVRNSFYKVEKRDYGTRSYQEVFEVFDKNSGNLIATIARLPYSKVLHPESCNIKFANSLLYYEKRIDLINDFLKRFEVQFLGISRIDIAADFTELYRNRSITGFMDLFMSNKLVKKGRAKVQAFFDNSGVGERVYKGLKFGSASSPVSYKIYNKTKELKEVSEKPYIVKWWEKNGLIQSAKTWQNSEVWRCEFTLKAQNSVFADSDGEFIEFHSLEVLEQKNIERIYQGLADKYLTFVQNRGVKNQRGKNSKIIYLIKLGVEGCTRYLGDVVKDVNRMSKIFIKMLYKRATREGQKLAQKELEKLIIDEIDSRCLWEWAWKRGIALHKNGQTRLI